MRASRTIGDYIKILYYFVALGITCYGLWLFYQRDILRWLPIVYVVASMVVFGLYEKDKLAAKNRMWRVRESTLHLFEWLGGWIGAFWGQMVCRHKTRKLSYQFTFWFIVTVHCAFWTDYALFNLQGISMIFDYFNSDFINQLNLDFYKPSHSNEIKGTIEWSNPRH